MIMIMLKILKGLVDLFPSLELNIPSIAPVNDALNIFAWARAFLPVDLFVTLAGLTALYYTFRLSFSLIKWILSIVLK